MLHKELCRLPLKASKLFIFAPEKEQESKPDPVFD